MFEELCTCPSFWYNTSPLYDLYKDRIHMVVFESVQGDLPHMTSNFSGLNYN